MAQSYDILQLCLLFSLTSLVIILTHALRRRKNTAAAKVRERLLERRLQEFEPRPLIEDARPLFEVQPRLLIDNALFEDVHAQPMNEKTQLLENVHLIEDAQPRPFFEDIQPRPVFEEALHRRPFREIQTVSDGENAKPRPFFEDIQPRPLHVSAQPRPFREIHSVSDNENTFDFAKVDFLSLSRDKTVVDSAANCIRKYSVGTCGPRGFFGTFDVHLELEERLADFMKTECGIVYSFGFITTPSCIHCYCKRDTTVFVDEHASYAIEMGVVTAGSRKVVFKHNDPQDFAGKAKQVNSGGLKVLVIEGICCYDGSICALPEFLGACKRHKVRILLDESISFGVLGVHGRGVTEYFQVDVDEIDVIMGSLEYALAGYGGFCVGSSMVVHPQRLASAGFVFSASLPTFCAQAAITTLGLVGGKPPKLRALSVAVHDFLCGFPELHVRSHRESPLKVFSTENGEHFRRCLADNGVHLLGGEGGVLKMNLFLDLARGEKLGKFFEIFGDVVEACLRKRHDEH